MRVGAHRSGMWMWLQVARQSANCRRAVRPHGWATYVPRCRSILRCATKRHDRLGRQSPCSWGGLGAAWCLNLLEPDEFHNRFGPLWATENTYAVGTMYGFIRLSGQGGWQGAGCANASSRARVSYQAIAANRVESDGRLAKHESQRYFYLAGVRAGQVRARSNHVRNQDATDTRRLLVRFP